MMNLAENIHWNLVGLRNGKMVIKTLYLILTISSGYLTNFDFPYGQQVDVDAYMENVEDGTRYI